MSEISRTCTTHCRSAIDAMILAAGRGERMRPLTDTCPKPLLRVHGKPLMQWPMEALARGGCQRVVINTAWLGNHIEQAFGDHFDIKPPSNGDMLLLNMEHTVHRQKIVYSHEGRDFGAALETAGGIARALPLLGDIFWVLAGDVFAPDFEFSIEAVARFAASDKLAHIWLVPNPAHNPKGDFGLGTDGLAVNVPAAQATPRLTYSTIGLYRRALFEAPYCPIPAGNPEGIKAPLAPLLRAAMDNQAVSAELYLGPWTDVGTPERLTELNASFSEQTPSP